MPHINLLSFFFLAFFVLFCLIFSSNGLDL